MSIKYLKIKIKSLAEESKLIRTEEHKQKRTYKDIKLRNLLREKGAVNGQKIGKWTVSQASNEAVTLTRNITPTKGESRIVNKKINLNWNPTPERLDKEVATFWGLRYHRTGKVRGESRDSLLAYAFIRGQTYRTAEITGNPISGFVYNFAQKRNVPQFNFDVANIARLATKYGDREVTSEEIIKWVLDGVYTEAAE